MLVAATRYGLSRVGSSGSLQLVLCLPSVLIGLSAVPRPTPAGPRLRLDHLLVLAGGLLFVYSAGVALTQAPRSTFFVSSALDFLFIALRAYMARTLDCPDGLAERPAVPVSAVAVVLGVVVVGDLAFHLGTGQRLGPSMDMAAAVLALASPIGLAGAGPAMLLWLRKTETSGPQVHFRSLLAIQGAARLARLSLRSAAWPDSGRELGGLRQAGLEVVTDGTPAHSGWGAGSRGHRREVDPTNEAKGTSAFVGRQEIDLESLMATDIAITPRTAPIADVADIWLDGEDLGGLLGLKQRCASLGGQLRRAEVSGLVVMAGAAAVGILASPSTDLGPITAFMSLGLVSRTVVMGAMRRKTLIRVR